MKYVYTSELYHHGIKGQKWGVRRFQNKDGSLTAEGYQHWGLNPDGSKFRGTRGHDRTYSDATAGAAKKGAFIGGAAGTALGVAAGAYNTHKMQKKIRSLLDEKGTVYVKDL